MYFKNVLNTSILYFHYKIFVQCINIIKMIYFQLFLLSPFNVKPIFDLDSELIMLSMVLFAFGP